MLEFTVYIAVTTVAWVRYLEMVSKSQRIQYMKDYAGTITLKFKLKHAFLSNPNL